MVVLLEKFFERMAARHFLNYSRIVAAVPLPKPFLLLVLQLFPTLAHRRAQDIAFKVVYPADRFHLLRRLLTF